MPLNPQVNTLVQQFRDMLWQLYRVKKPELSFKKIDEKSSKNRWAKMVGPHGAPGGEVAVRESRDAIAIG